MIGIVYKFTIIAKYKMDGHHPFYIGQHWCKSKEDFLDKNYPYYGSGSIWNDFLKRLRKDYPQKWRYFIRREILCFVTNKDSQSTLDKLEEYWIKREKSHKSEHLGGCNILWGTSNKFGSGSPMKDPNVADKVSATLKKLYSTDVGRELRRKISQTQRNRVRSDEERRKRKENAPKGKDSYWFGKHLSKETRELIARKAKERYKDANYKKMVRDKTNYRRGEEHQNFGKHMFVGKNNPFYGKRHTDESKKKMSDSHKKIKL